MTTDTLHRTDSRSSTSLWTKLFVTEDRWAPAILRLTLAVVMFPHGAQKLLGWFGGGGYSATMTNFTEGMGLPWIVAFLVIIIEFFGALALALGAATRLAAAGIGAVMIGAIVTVHAQHGFFMNWGGNQAGEGFEFHLLALGIVVALMVAGGGSGSIDRMLTTRRST
ncbi:DoxX family protein [Persicimonas caeni]|uniref:DoxX family protein n=1 Tax=Persicimonas caeni TaxID=2292766 RepID=A0A4Y6PVF8_PERCE|nr:DoxX family protein [Persicimonas caeni]QDG52312.1 DoxX family protein [Persicimonas caeni]QED33534.1 DoxX family protein [Persicimonas caeni]